MLPLCRQHDSLLLVIDIQERLVSAMGKKSRLRLEKNSALLIDTASLLKVPVFHTEQYPKGLGSTLQTLGQRLEESSIKTEKTSFSCCGEPSFQAQLRETHKRQIIITGLESHVCVLQTALELEKQGFEVYVVEDAIASRKKSNHHNALARMRQQGVIISNTESVLFEWLRDTNHPSFKAVSALLK